MPLIDDLLAVLARGEAERYSSDRVNLLQHALQCAAKAEAAGAPAAMVAAALMHDIGHLVDRKFEGAAARGDDRHHEVIGAAFLRTWFPEAVTEPIRLHVPAKRYLCASETTYTAGLSPASVRSLALQGGAMSAEARAAFAAEPYAEEGLQLRRWDEAAKDPDAKPPRLDHFTPILETVLAGSTRKGA